MDNSDGIRKMKKVNVSPLQVEKEDEERARWIQSQPDSPILGLVEPAARQVFNSPPPIFGSSGNDSSGNNSTTFPILSPVSSPMDGTPPVKLHDEGLVTDDVQLQAESCKSSTSAGGSSNSRGTVDDQHHVAAAAKAAVVATTSQQPSPVKPEWSPLDDGIEVALPNGSDKSPSREEVEAYISSPPNDPIDKRRLPVFEQVCDRHFVQVYRRRRKKGIAGLVSDSAGQIEKRKDK